LLGRPSWRPRDKCNVIFEENKIGFFTTGKILQILVIKSQDLDPL
jgi:hypothetical protein